MPHDEVITLPLFPLINAINDLDDLADIHACASLGALVERLHAMINDVRPKTYDT